MSNQINQLLSTAKGLVRLASRRRLSWLVYLWQDRAFYQNEALFAGMRRNRDGGGAVYSLRRNIHRIEKGLLASTPKGTFAVAYILETVDLFQRLSSTGACDQNTITWASAVLNRYFTVVDHEGTIADAYARFQSCGKPTEATWVPYLAETRPPLTVTYEDLLTGTKAQKYTLLSGPHRGLCVAPTSPGGGSPCARRLQSPVLRVPLF